MQNIFMCLENLLIEAKQAEIDDNAEDAFYYHMQISAHYKRCGKLQLAKLHKDKAHVYDDEELPKMTFVMNLYRVVAKDKNGVTQHFDVEAQTPKAARIEVEEENPQLSVIDVNLKVRK